MQFQSYEKTIPYVKTFINESPFIVVIVFEKRKKGKY